MDADNAKLLAVLADADILIDNDKWFLSESPVLRMKSCRTSASDAGYDDVIDCVLPDASDVRSTATKYHRQRCHHTTRCCSNNNISRCRTAG